jgi:inosine-uridine nucleoside N-ribohydrolase
MWDELAAAAWVDGSYITSAKKYFMDVSLDRGASYGDVVIWSDRVKPDLDVQSVNVQIDVDMKKFGDFFVKLMTGPTAGAHNPLMLKEPADGGPPKN